MRKGTAYFPVSKLLTVKRSRRCVSVLHHSGQPGSTAWRLPCIRGCKVKQSVYSERSKTMTPAQAPLPFFGNVETHGMSNLSPGTASPHRGNYNVHPGRGCDSLQQRRSLVGWAKVQG